MYLRVCDSRDGSCQPAPSPSLWYPLTHAHRCVGYHNLNPHPLPESVTRLMYVRVYDNPDNSRHPAPSSSLSYSITHVLYPPRAYPVLSHMYITPSPHPRSSRSHTLRYFGFLNVWPVLQFPSVWPLGLGLLYVYPRNTVYVMCSRSSCFSVLSSHYTDTHFYTLSYLSLYSYNKQQQIKNFSYLSFRQKNIQLIELTE